MRSLFPKRHVNLAPASLPPATGLGLGGRLPLLRRDQSLPCRRGPSFLFAGNVDGLVVLVARLLFLGGVLLLRGALFVARFRLLPLFLFRRRGRGLVGIFVPENWLRSRVSPGFFSHG